MEKAAGLLSDSEKAEGETKDGDVDENKVPEVTLCFLSLMDILYFIYSIIKLLLFYRYVQSHELHVLVFLV